MWRVVYSQAMLRQGITMFIKSDRNKNFITSSSQRSCLCIRPYNMLLVNSEKYMTMHWPCSHDLEIQPLPAWPEKREVSFSLHSGDMKALLFTFNCFLSYCSEAGQTVTVISRLLITHHGQIQLKWSQYKNPLYCLTLPNYFRLTTIHTV